MLNEVPPQPPPDGIPCQIVFNPTQGIVVSIACPALQNRILMKGMLLEALRVVDVWNDQHQSRIVAPPPGLNLGGHS